MESRRRPRRGDGVVLVAAWWIRVDARGRCSRSRLVRSRRARRGGHRLRTVPHAQAWWRSRASSRCSSPPGSSAATRSVERCRSRRPSWRIWAVLAVVAFGVFGSYGAYHPLTGGWFRREPRRPASGTLSIVVTLKNPSWAERDNPPRRRRRRRRPAGDRAHAPVHARSSLPDRPLRSSHKGCVLTRRECHVLGPRPDIEPALHRMPVRLSLAPALSGSPVRPRSANEWRDFWRDGGERELHAQLDEFAPYSVRIATLLGSAAPLRARRRRAREDPRARPPRARRPRARRGDRDAHPRLVPGHARERLRGHRPRRRRARRRAPHRARRRPHAGLHARRDEGDRQGRRPRRAPRSRRADHPRQHVPPPSAARRGAHRRARRAPQVHGLGRADPHGFGRFPGLFSPRHAARGGRRRRDVPLGLRRERRSGSRRSSRRRSRSGSGRTSRCASTSACPRARRAPSSRRRCAARRSGPSGSATCRARPASSASRSRRAASTPSYASARRRNSSRSTSTATRSAASAWGSTASRCSTRRRAAAAFLPEEKPRYFMGIGDPEGVLEVIARGVDMFDCVLPTRTARTGSALTREGRLNLRNAQYARDRAAARRDAANAPLASGSAARTSGILSTNRKSSDCDCSVCIISASCSISSPVRGRRSSAANS